MKHFTTQIFILLLILIAAALIFPQPKKVIIKGNVSNLPNGSQVYITGNNNELGNWDFMQKMERETHGVWSYIVTLKTGDTLKFKFTRGSWASEAVDSNGIEFPNFVYVVQSDTTLFYKLSGWRDLAQHKIYITPERLANKEGYIELIEGWKYKAGDDSSWVDPSFNDSSWQEVNPELDKETLEKIEWTGNAWFRNHIYVDSAYRNTTFGLMFINTGAAEVYLDGKLLYRIGTIGNSAITEVRRIDRKPKYITFGEGEENVLAIRYSNHSAEEMIKYNVELGFTAMIMDLNTMISQNVDSVRDATILQFVFSAFILAFAIMHLLLFIFYPRAKENLFYSIAMLGFAVVIYTAPQIGFADSFNKIVDLAIINSLAVQAAILFGLLTIYVSTYDKMPRHYLVFVIFSSLFAIINLFMPERELILNYIFYGYSIIVIIEMIRVVIRSVKRKDPWGWGWIVGAGFIVAMIFIAYQVLILTGVIQQPLFGIRYVYVYGIVFLAVTVSINLSKKVSDTNKNLEKQLIQVKELSQITIEQERKAREEEIVRKILKADNDRKTKELEEARLLQLSMLPKKLPSVPHLDIAVFMKPATEVGGDYYDFKYDDNGNLIIAVGDATGHGMKAGTMVATVKGLFTAEKTDVDIVSFLGKSNAVIKDMQLGNIFMAMLLVKINGNKAVFSSAGMPPALIFRNSTRTIEEVRLQAMPLGGPADFNFPKKEVTLSAGDTLLLMSDGFPELFNGQKEILGYDTAKNIFNSVANKEPDKIIEHLCSEAEKWRDDADQEDDITFVVVQLKSAAQA